MNKQKMAGDLRPGHNVSFTGLEQDMAHVTQIEISRDYSNVEITIEIGDSKFLPIDFPVTIFLS